MRAAEKGFWSGLLFVVATGCGGSDTNSGLFGEVDAGFAGASIDGSNPDRAGGQSGGDSSLGGGTGGAAGSSVDSSNGDTISGPGADGDALVADGSDTATGDAAGDGLVDVTSDGTVEAGPGDASSEASVDAASEAGVDASCTAAVTCYGGPSSELLAPSTACRAGTSYCINGSSGSCIGEVRPTPESCNGIDDDCNGSIDDGLGTMSCGQGACTNTVAACVNGKPGTCQPLPAASNEICGDGIDNNCNGIVDEGCACVYVSLTGSDATGTGSTVAPLRTISRAISLAGANGLAKQVCVAGTTACAGAAGVATYIESVVMRDGISVLGGYSPVGAVWPRAANCVTVIQAVDATGLQFGVSVTSSTVLDGFTVNAEATGVNAAVTISGSTGAVVQNDTINGGAGSSSSTTGILVQDSSGTKATPIIRDVAVNGGVGSALAIGVSVVNSAATLRHNCSAFDVAGSCAALGCSASTSFIRGRSAGNTGTPGAQTYAVRLQGASGTIIETSALCSSDGQGDVAGLRLSGASSGVVIRQNSIIAPAGATGNVNSVGVWMDACAGASPWIFGNSNISGQSRTIGGRADGIRAIGDCHPRIDSNETIVGGEESAQNDAIGVYCARDAGTGVSSQCTVLDNRSIRGSGSGFPPTATGVKCDAGACARIERNGITGYQGMSTFGVVLNGASTFVDRNVIDAGCAQGEGIGLFAIDAPARVQNNVIRGASCVANSPTSSYAARVQIGTGLAEIDLHSNTLLAMGGGTMCTGRALELELLGGAPGGPRGVVRNNILDVGTCATAYGVVEAVAASDPRIFENNDIWYSTAATALYRDEGTTNLMLIGAVNGLTDIASSQNISRDPMFATAVNYHILASSGCRNMGTSTRAPSYDLDGLARPSETFFDIGAYEFHP